MAKIKRQFDLNTIKRLVLLAITAVLIGCLAWASFGWSLDQTSDYLFWLYGGNPISQGSLLDRLSIASILSWIIQYGSIGFMAAASRSRKRSFEWYTLIALGIACEAIDAGTNIGAFNLRPLPEGRYDDQLGKAVGYGVCIVVARAEELLLWTLSFAAEMIYEIGEESGAKMPKWLKSQSGQHPQQRPAVNQQPVRVQQDYRQSGR